MYRGHNPRWAFDPESGDGACRHGGRFNPAGTTCLYTSTTPETAWLEAQQAFPFKAQPLTLCEYTVDCQEILDLTDADVRAASGVQLDDMSCAWEDLADMGKTPPSWIIAEKLIAEKCAGIMTPSFATGADTNNINVVFWRWSRRKPHLVRVVDDHGRLPKDDASWR